MWTPCRCHTRPRPALTLSWERLHRSSTPTTMHFVPCEPGSTRELPKPSDTQLRNCASGCAKDPETAECRTSGTLSGSDANCRRYLGVRTLYLGVGTTPPTETTGRHGSTPAPWKACGAGRSSTEKSFSARRQAACSEAE